MVTSEDFLLPGCLTDPLLFPNYHWALSTEKTSVLLCKFLWDELELQTTGKGAGDVLNRNLGRGVRPTQQNPDPVQDTKDVNFATLS